MSEKENELKKDGFKLVCKAKDFEKEWKDMKDKIEEEGLLNN